MNQHQKIAIVNQCSATYRKMMDKDTANDTCWYGWATKLINWIPDNAFDLINNEFMAGLSDSTGRKRKEDIIGISFVFLDIDDQVYNPDGTKMADELVIPHVIRRLEEAGYTFVLATSANHMREKITKTKVLPAIPRFKALIPYVKPLDLRTDGRQDARKVKQYANSHKTMIDYFENLLGVQLDHSAFQGNRYSYRCNPALEGYQEHFSYGVGFDITQYLAPLPEPVQDVVRPVRQYQSGNGQDNGILAAEYFFSDHRPYHDWFKMSCCVAETYGFNQLALMTQLTSAEKIYFSKKQVDSKTGAIVNLAKEYGFEIPKYVPRSLKSTGFKFPV